MPRTDFKPNDIQTALFVEVMNASLSESGDHLRDNAEVIHAWLLEMKPTLMQLARTGRGALGSSERTRDEMIGGLMAGVTALDPDTFRWLTDWRCLNDLVSPAALRAAPTVEGLRANFTALASIDAGL